MCTLIVGRDVLGAGTLIVAANRDESPQRPSEPPRVLSEQPRVCGGRDGVAGGTWLAVRENQAAIAMLNRRGPDHAAAGGDPPRSRGLLAIEVALTEMGGGGPQDLSHGMLATVRHAIRRDRYAPFSIVCLIPAAPWVMSYDPGQTPWVRELNAGWHVLTHEDLDDPAEPRTARLVKTLDGWKPATLEAAEEGLIERLSLHGDPAVCIHEGPMPTVSTSLLALGAAAPRYLHIEGRPCEKRPTDHSALLLGATTPGPGRD